MNASIDMMMMRRSLSVGPLMKSLSPTRRELSTNHVQLNQQVNKRYQRYSHGVVEETTPLSRALERYLPLLDTNIQTDMSTLVFALDTMDHNQVVLKTQSQPNDELTILHKIAHYAIPHCIHLKDSFINAHDHTVLVLPCIPIQSTVHWDLKEIQSIMRNVLQALKQLHSHGIAHLDVTRNNILVHQETKEAILIDFGLSRCFSHLKKNDYHPIRGTPGYIAPEMLAGEALGGTSDVYSLGVVFGQYLQSYIRHPSLHVLGSKLVDPTITTSIARKIMESLDEQAFHDQLPLYDSNPSSPLPRESYCNLPIVQQAAHLLARLLDPDATRRITASEALKHPFMTASLEAFQGTDYLEYQAAYPQTLLVPTTRRREQSIVYYR